MLRLSRSPFLFDALADARLKAAIEFVDEELRARGHRTPSLKSRGASLTMRRKWAVLALIAVGTLAPTVMASEAEHVIDVPPNGKLQVSVNGQTVDTFSGSGMPSVLSLRRSVALGPLQSKNEPRQRGDSS